MITNYLLPLIGQVRLDVNRSCGADHKTLINLVVDDSVTAGKIKTLVNRVEIFRNEDYHSFLEGGGLGLEPLQVPTTAEFAERARVVGQWFMGRTQDETFDYLYSFFGEFDYGDTPARRAVQETGIFSKIRWFHGCQVLQGEYGVGEYWFNFLHITLSKNFSFTNGSKELLLRDQITFGPQEVNTLPSLDFSCLGFTCNFNHMLICLMNDVRRSFYIPPLLDRIVDRGTLALESEIRDIFGIYRRKSGLAGLVYPIGYICKRTDTDPIKP